MGTLTDATVATDSQAEGVGSTAEKSGPDGKANGADGAGQNANGESLPRDELFTLLSNRRRRWVLHYLERDESGEADLRTLVDTVAAWEFDAPVGELSWKKRKRVYTALRQSHLPKLDAAGVVEYDESRGHVRLTDEADEVRVYMEYVPANDMPWSQYYLGLSAIGLALVSAAWFAIGPFAGVSGLGLALLLVLAFSVSALVHEFHLRRNQLGSGEGPPEPR